MATKDAEMGTTVPVNTFPQQAQHQDDTHSETNSLKASSVFRKALRMGRVEEKGIQPLPVEERTVTKFYQIFTVWCSINSNILG